MRGRERLEPDILQSPISAENWTNWVRRLESCGHSFKYGFQNLKIDEILMILDGFCPLAPIFKVVWSALIWKIQGGLDFIGINPSKIIFTIPPVHHEK